MALRSVSNPKNADGNFFVDTSCIGCGACKNLALDIYEIEDELSYIKKQPKSEEELYDAYLALHTCPVHAIGVKEDKDSSRQFLKNLPLHLEEGVYFCSYNSPKSYGANSYFIKREKGNILVDSPRFDKRLVSKLEQLGGIEYVYLTHKDDVADYQKFKEHFDAKVIYHEDDFNSKIQTADIILKGEDEFILDDEVKIIPQPGHTKGHTVLLYKDFYLFSGDHLAYNVEGGYLHAFKNYCWYDWQSLLKSLRKLLNYEFGYVLAGHGGSLKSSKEDMRQRVESYLRRYDN